MIAKGRYVNFLILFVCTILSGSFCIIAKAGYIRLLLMLALDVIILIFKKVKLSQNSILILFILFVLQVINGESIKCIIITEIFVMTALFVKEIVDFESFYYCYVKMMFILAIGALLLEGITFLAPFILQFLPVSTNINGVAVYNILWAVQMKNSYRLQGLFWEPGAYQCFSHIAIMLLLFDDQERFPMRKKCVMLLLLLGTTLLTLSSTAYIIFAMEFAFSVIQLLSRNKKNRKIYLVIVGMALACLPVVINLPASYQFLIYGKFKAFINKSNVNLTSVTTRLDALKACLDCIKMNFLFGVGETRLLAYMKENYGHSNALVTYLNWFAKYGIFVGLFCCKLTFSVSKRICDNLVDTLYFCLMLGLMTFSEDLSIVPVYLTFLFYGLENTVKRDPV